MASPHNNSRTGLRVLWKRSSGSGREEKFRAPGKNPPGPEPRGVGHDRRPRLRGGGVMTTQPPFPRKRRRPWNAPGIVSLPRSGANANA